MGSVFMATFDSNSRKSEDISSFSYQWIIFVFFEPFLLDNLVG